jgi:uncharacterized membrane protein
MEVLSFLKRIRWISVIGLIILVVLIGAIVFLIPSRYSTKGDVSVDAKANPSTVKIGERSKIDIEVRNLNKDNEITVSVEARTYDDVLQFTHTDEKYESKKDILIGPKESRKLTFEVRPLSGALPGKYRIDVTAREKSYAEGAEDTVYINVKKD